MTQTFPSYTPVFPTTLTIEPRWQGMDAGGQVAAERVLGLSRIPIKRNLEFRTNVVDSVRIGWFLAARDRDNQSFYYTHPNDVQRRYCCSEWTRTQPYCDHVFIKATFIEVYEF